MSFVVVTDREAALLTLTWLAVAHQEAFEALTGDPPALPPGSEGLSGALDSDDLLELRGRLLADGMSTAIATVRALIGGNCSDRPGCPPNSAMALFGAMKTSLD